MGNDRYHVQVQVRDGYGNTLVWRRVHPTGGDPYVFTKAEAEAHIRSQGIEHRHAFRLEKLPE